MREREREREKKNDRQRVFEVKKGGSRLVAAFRRCVRAVSRSLRSFFWLTFLLAGSGALGPSSMTVAVTVAFAVRVHDVRRRRRRRGGRGGGRSGRCGDVADARVALFARKREGSNRSSGGDPRGGRRRAALGTAAWARHAGRRSADENVLHGERRRQSKKKARAFYLSFLFFSFFVFCFLEGTDKKSTEEKKKEGENSTSLLLLPPETRDVIHAQVPRQRPAHPPEESAHGRGGTSFPVIFSSSCSKEPPPCRLVIL